MADKEEKPRILFLSAGNACRSQMAEGWMRHFHSRSLEAFSGAVEKPIGLNLIAVRVMQEAGVDITGHYSKAADEIGKACYDHVVALCEEAVMHGDRFSSGGTVRAQIFDDPVRLAALAANEEQVLDHYRRIRDAICLYVEDLPYLILDAGLQSRRLL